MKDAHHDLIRDQFTRQAEVFATAPALHDRESLELAVRATRAGSRDRVLDVACGPGTVTCAFAEVAAQATGIDLTPAMLGQARRIQSEKALANVSWCVGDVARLPFDVATFDVVVSRFAFHHMKTPAAALAEMARACRPGGRVAVIDVAVSTDPRKADAYNRMELLRDPSHVRAMTLAELQGLFAAQGLHAPRIESYRLSVTVGPVLERSFPNPGDDAKVRAMFEESLADDGMGVASRRDGDDIRFDYPIAVLVSER